MIAGVVPGDVVERLSKMSMSGKFLPRDRRRAPDGRARRQYRIWRAVVAQRRHHVLRNAAAADQRDRVSCHVTAG